MVIEMHLLMWLLNELICYYRSRKTKNLPRPGKEQSIGLDRRSSLFWNRGKFVCDKFNIYASMFENVWYYNDTWYSMKLSIGVEWERW